MKQRLLFLFLLFLIGGIASAEAQNYNADEIEKLKAFLIQESADPGVMNYEQIGIGDPSAWDVNTIQWDNYGITWEETGGEHRLSTIGWIDKKLAGKLDVSGCTALTHLWCYDNRLTSLNVSGCTELMILLCYDNRLTSLDISGCTALTGLWCNGNSLTSLNVSGCTKLTNLQCNNNSLTSLNVSGCTLLTELYCFINRLTSLNVSGCMALTRLWCNNNSLTALNVSGCTKLEYLDCSINHLTSLDVSSCTKLGYLYCFNNNLTSLNVSGCILLTELSTYENNLISLNLSDCTALTRLDCYINSLTSLNLSGCTKLTYLQCSYNNLTSLDVSGCTTLMHLWCSDNSLISLDVSDCTKLIELYCFNNNLTSLDVSGYTMLKYLQCSDNSLISLDVLGCTKLTKLYCERNSLTSLDVSDCTLLTKLYCFDNSLISLDVSGYIMLTELWCSGNSLTSLDVLGCTELAELYCSGNSLTSLDVSGCTKLETLWCSGNSLTFTDLNAIKDEPGVNLVDFFYYSQTHETVLPFLWNSPIDINSLLDPKDNYSYDHTCYNEGGYKIEGTSFINGILTLPANYIGKVEMHIWSDNFPIQNNNPTLIYTFLVRSGIVSFDSQGGSAVGQLEVNPETQTIDRPADPVREGYVFGGWYTQPTGGKHWNFNDPVQGDMKLYARWNAIVTLPQMNGITYDRKAGDYTIVSGSTFRFTIIKNAAYSHSELVVTTSDGTPVRLIDPAKNTYELTVWGNTTIIVEGLRLNTYTVNIESVGGCLMFPGTGEHKVRIWNDFTFSIRLLNEYSHSVPVVKVNGEELAYESYRDLMGGEYSYKVKNITEDIAITIEGIDRNATSIPELTPQPPKGGAKVWITPGQIHVSIDSPSSGGRGAGVRIYTVNGQLVATSHLSSFTCKVPAGLYIVVAGEETFKVSVK